jgi:hypothetical protein
MHETKSDLPARLGDSTSSSKRLSTSFRYSKKNEFHLYRRPSQHPQRCMLYPMNFAVAAVNAPGDQVLEIVIGGSRHLPARDIARTYGYAPD